MKVLHVGTYWFAFVARRYCWMRQSRKCAYLLGVGFVWILRAYTAAVLVGTSLWKRILQRCICRVACTHHLDFDLCVCVCCEIANSPTSERANMHKNEETSFTYNPPDDGTSVTTISCGIAKEHASREFWTHRSLISTFGQPRSPLCFRDFFHWNVPNGQTVFGCKFFLDSIDFILGVPGEFKVDNSLST